MVNATAAAPALATSRTKLPRSNKRIFASLSAALLFDPLRGFGHDLIGGRDPGLVGPLVDSNRFGIDLD